MHECSEGNYRQTAVLCGSGYAVGLTDTVKEV